MLEFKDVPYRRWKGRALIHTGVGRKVMDIMGKEMKAGRAVEFHQSQPINTHADDTREPARVYDTISVTIRD